MAKTKCKYKKIEPGIFRMPDGKYRARIVRIGRNGKPKQYTREGDDVSEARRHKKDLEREFEQLGVRGMDASKIRFRELAEQYQNLYLIPAVYDDPDSEHRVKVAGRKRWKDARRFLQAITDHFGRMLISEIESEHVLEFKIKRIEEPKMRADKNLGRRSIAAVNRELEQMQACLNYAIRKRWLTVNPVKGMICKADERRRDVVIDYEQEQLLLDACYDTKTGVIHMANLRKALIGLIETGMRPGEIRFLKRKDVDMINRNIIVQVRNSKTQKQRKVPITDRLYEVLEEIFAKLPNHPDELVFGVKTSWKKSFATAKKRAGLDGIIGNDCTLRIGDLRHVGVTRLKECDVDTQTSMDIIGHTEDRTHRRYSSMTDHRLQSTAAKLDAHRAKMTAKIQTEIAATAASEAVN